MIPELANAINFVLSDEGNFCSDLYIVWGAWLLLLLIINYLIDFSKRKKKKS